MREGQGRDPNDALARHTQRNATRHQHGQTRTRAEHLAKSRARIDDLLEIIENQESHALAQERGETGQRRTVVQLAYSESLDDGGEDELWIADSSQGNECGAVGKVR
ncbi:MAG: hypothetical protein M3Q50_11070 [Chloroflexota bacterium]|nr:hypothetical protein [Chloroflexota bacterium]